MQKIIFSAKGEGWDAQLDERFGRARGFLLYNEESQTLTWHSNQENLNAAHGAGTQAAQFVINTGASVVITGQIGPKAFSILSKAGIKVFNSATAPIKQVYSAYKEGILKQQST